MILFKPQFIQPILKGRKTQTRRVGKKRWNVGSVHMAKTGLLCEDPFARLRITGVRRSLLGWITHEEAEKEGFDCVADFNHAWRQIHGEWSPKQEVWVIDFEVM